MGLGTLARADQGPHADPDAQVALGLAAMERQEPEAALAHFEAALQQGGSDWGDAPVVIFNRGVCLFALARFADAEDAFVTAGRVADAPLSGLASINAGLAALALQATERAARHLSQARRQDPDGQLQELTVDLAADIEAARAPPADRGHAENAKDENAEDTHDAAEKRFQAAAAAFQAGRFADARRQMRQARAGGLSATRSRQADTYLDVMAGGLRARGRGLRVQAFAAGGADTNVNEIGASATNSAVGGSSAEEPSAYLRLGVDATYGLAPSDTTFVRVDYAVNQLAYLAAAVNTFSTQLHQLSLRAEVRPTQTLRLSLGASAGFDLIGRDFDPLSMFAGGQARMGAQYGQGFETELSGGLTFTEHLDDDFGFLTGHRLELAVAQTWQTSTWALGAELRYRRDELGTQTIARDLPLTADAQVRERLENNPELQAAFEAIAVPGALVVPLAHEAPAAEVFVDVRLSRWLRLNVSGAIEWRNYLSQTTATVDDTVLMAIASNDNTRLAQLAAAIEGPVRTQRDLRYTGTVTWLIAPLEDVWVGLTYVVVRGDSNIDNTRGDRHAYDYANLNFLRHLVETSLSVSFD